MTKCEMILKACGLTADQVRRANGRHMRPVAAVTATLIVFDRDPRPQPKKFVPRMRRERRSSSTPDGLPTAVAYGLYGHGGPTSVFCGDYGFGCWA